MHTMTRDIRLYDSGREASDFLALRDDSYQLLFTKNDARCAPSDTRPVAGRLSPGRRSGLLITASPTRRHRQTLRHHFATATVIEAVQQK